MKLDLVIKNGRIIDPASGTDKTGDLGIKNGRFVDLDAFDGELEAEQVLEASGYVVTPGLIDSHVHVFDKGCDLGIPADLVMIPNGVTAVGEGGSCGISNYRSFLAMMAGSELTHKMLVNVSPAGLSTFQYPETILPEKWNLDQFKRAFDLDREHLMGLKLRISDEVVGDRGMAILEQCLKLAETLHTRLVVHVTATGLDQAELVDRLREGDIYCHVYQGFGETILEKDGRVKEAFFKARKRGVILDAASGKNNFCFFVAKKALEQGLTPDVICSDVSSMNYLRDYVGNGLPYIMSKFLALGMELSEVVRRVTVNPARLMGLSEGAGSLRAGSLADAAIFKIKEGRVEFIDSMNQKLEGNRLLIPMAAIKSGRLLYKNMEI